MAHRSLLSEAVDRYLGTVVVHESPVQKRLRAETSKLPEAGMQIGADQGVFLAFLARLVGTRRAIEIGTFTGYSALSVASVLPPDGRLVCCDVSEEWTSIARRYWAEAGLAERIELRLAPARETLAQLRKRDGPASYDFAFIDADKTGYDAYYEACLELIRVGGLIAIDNVLWSGTVADPSDMRPDTVALRAITAKIRDDPRVDACLVSLGDGVMLARKR
jgi:predicted O-methyltransferase YrrM